MDPQELPVGIRRLRLVAISVTALLGMIIVLVVIVSVLPDDGGADDPVAAPPVELDTLDGGTFRLADLEGQPVVVNFWASWCPPCVIEMPDIEAVYQERGDEIGFVGINVSDREADARETLEQTGVTYTIALDPTGDVVEQFEGLAMPTTAFVSADGTIVEVHSGIVDESELHAMIEEHLTP